MDARGNASYKIKRMSVVADSYFEMPEWDNNKYEKVSATEARDMWQIEYDNYPTTRKQNHTIVKGLILPIWNRLPEKISVRRYIDEKGKAHLGRFFFGRDIQNIMENFGVNANNFTTQQLKDILKSGGRIKLSNGFILAKATYMGLNVAHIQRAVGYKDRDRLQRAGAIYQVTSSLSGYGNFYITFDNFNEALDEIIRLYNAPVIRVEDENGDPVNNVGSIQMMVDQLEANKNIKNVTPADRAIVERLIPVLQKTGLAKEVKIVTT